MIRMLGRSVTVHRHHRSERSLYLWTVPSVYGRIYRKNGQSRASLCVSGRDEAGCHIDVRADARNLRDAEVMVLAALERRGLKDWADRLMGGAA